MVRVGKNSGPVFTRLWTKVHEILGQCRRSFVLFNTFTEYLDITFRSEGRRGIMITREPNHSGAVFKSYVKITVITVRNRNNLLCSRSMIFTDLVMYCIDRNCLRLSISDFLVSFFPHFSCTSSKETSTTKSLAHTPMRCGGPW